MLHEERDDCWVDGAAARAHHKAVERGEAHRRVHGNAVVYRGDGAAVAQMAGDKADLAKVFPKNGRRALAQVTMRGAMKAVFADAVLLVVLVRNGVHVGVLRQRLEERGIEHRHHRRFGHKRTTGVDARKGCLVVKRRQFRQVVDLRDNVFGDERRLLEELAAVHDAVAHCRDLAHVLDNGLRTGGKHIEHHAHGRRVVGQRQVVHVLIVVDAVLVEGLLRANAFA